VSEQNQGEGEQPAESEWLTTEGLSARLGGIPTATIRHWRHVGTGPDWVKFGGAVRYRKSAVDSWIAACEQRGAVPKTTPRRSAVRSQ
jgi:predicted DNA-binding transcriptional regulator AlpA